MSEGLIQGFERRRLAGDGVRIDTLVGGILKHQAAEGFTFDPECLADYIACARDPGMIRGMCEDYRAGWTIDRKLDEADRDHGNRIIAPTLCLWGDQGMITRTEPLKIWSRWANTVTGRPIRCGHFLPEEAPAEVAAAVAGSMSGHSRFVMYRFSLSCRPAAAHRSKLQRAFDATLERAS